jgi:hypothetical protein
MKFLYWSVGVMQILTGFMLAWSIAPAWRWVWITAAVVWFFAGVVLGLLGLSRLVAGKVGAGGGAGLPRRTTTPPAPQKEE